MYPWVKLVFRKFLYRHYKWLYVNLRSNGVRVFVSDAGNYCTIKLTNLTYAIKPYLDKAGLYYLTTARDCVNSDSPYLFVK